MKLEVLAFATVLGATACDAQDSGSAPEISALELSAATVTVGATNTVTVTFDFVDDDGDLDEVEIVLGAAGQELTLASPIVGADGMTDGQAMVQLVVQPMVAGEVAVELVAVDEEGNRSNALNATLDAVAALQCETDECDGATQLRAWLEPM